MKYLTSKYNQTILYPQDVERIILAAKDFGYDISIEQADTLWHMFSTMLCAGWILLPETNKEIFNSIEPYIDANYDVFEDEED